jgi:hypothetical protein
MHGLPVKTVHSDLHGLPVQSKINCAKTLLQ